MIKFASFPSIYIRTIATKKRIEVAIFILQPKKDQSFRIFLILYKKFRGFLKGLQKKFEYF